MWHRNWNVLMFPPSEITVGVIDDDIFEEDEYFYVHLSNPRVVGYPEIGTAPLDTSDTPKAVLGENHTATVTIYDDDHAGESETRRQLSPSLSYCWMQSHHIDV